ncbi:Phospholipase/carboxylesterase [Pisolithus thermaeus]|nr:Phospholipase/carboxylesterase [Pisolithus croceorrhizus]KAI6165736.1 Phospholipase/carboxylesterase [Pisolithus thermaeus]
MSTPLIVQAVKRHTATVIFLHGLGDSGRGWLPVAQMLGKDPELQHIKWILPNAPTRAVTANYGLEMPGWFDIYTFSFKESGEEDRDGMLESAGILETLIRDEIATGVDSNRIVLGGFSQGGAMSLLTGLTSSSRLGGLVVLSGWLPIRNEIKKRLASHAPSLPIFMGHGASDPLVPCRIAKISAEYLSGELGIASQEKVGEPGLTFKEYPGLVHSASPEELEDVAVFLRRVIPASQ